MKPDKIYSGRSTIRMYRADCMELMKGKPENYWQLSIVDPPYGLDLANMNMGLGKSKKASKKENRDWVAKDWDNNAPDEFYFKVLFDSTVNQIIWGGNYFNLPPCYGYVIWDKERPEGLSFSDCEMAWYSFKKVPSIFRYSAYLDKKNKFHPTQKPVQLYKWLLTNYAKEGDRILDTHGGSLSIAIACWDMGFDLDVCELDKEYFDMAVKRFENHISQTQLF